jgi:hypothetical protein
VAGGAVHHTSAFGQGQTEVEEAAPYWSPWVVALQVAVDAAATCDAALGRAPWATVDPPLYLNQLQRRR